MFIELVDSLRCLAPHEDSWLVLAADRMEGRRVIEGTLGCPLCRATYSIRGGVAWFGVAPTTEGETRSAPTDDAAGEGMRLAALLGLAEAGARALLVGAWGALAEEVLAIVPAQLLLLDPPAGTLPGEGVSIIRAGGRVPLAAGAVSGAALDDVAARSPERVSAVLRTVRARGRVVAPVGLARPADLEELARDERHWVATTGAPASAPVRLRRV